MRIAKSLFAFLFALSLAIAPPVSNAQDLDFKLGPRVSLDVDDIDEFGVGADVRAAIGDTPVQIHGAFDWYFADDPLTIFTVDANGVYMFDLEDQNITPYAGGGLGITRFDLDTTNGGFGVSASTTEIGLNLVGGAELDLDGTLPFAQLQFTTGTPGRLALSAGILFDI